ncbi:MAG: Ppx/GppA family phosphatase [Heliobacteriaceae bacterium]|nr:Ppx/GppA family phosphatase [Heliobacteriaceae bacterium]
MTQQGRVWGAIDLGSNSVRFLAARLAGGGVVPLWRHLATTRLGGQGAIPGFLPAPAVARTLTVLRSGMQQMQVLGVRPEAIAAFATSAVREARDGDAFCRRIRTELGLRVQVLPGELEGRLSYEGAVGGLPAKLIAGQNPVVVDIGGGSTEVVFQGETFWHRSFPVGAVRATDAGLDRQAIATVLAPAFAAVGQRRGLLVGVGGTVTTLGAMVLKLADYVPERVHGLTVSLATSRQFWERLWLMDPAQRKKVAGLPPERAGIIPAGLLILVTFMEEAGFDRIVVSETDLLYSALGRLAAGRWPPA